jgi:hypothetical protein
VVIKYKKSLPQLAGVIIQLGRFFFLVLDLGFSFNAPKLTSRAVSSFSQTQPHHVDGGHIF